MSVFKLSEDNRFHVINEYYNEIKLLSNKIILTDIWLGKNNKYEYSYDDLIFNLLEDSFICFVNEDTTRLNFKTKLTEQLVLLKDNLFNYNKKIPNNKWMDDKILEDPQFDVIIEQAGKVVALWEKDEVAKKYINIG